VLSTRSIAYGVAKVLRARGRNARVHLRQSGAQGTRGEDRAEFGTVPVFSAMSPKDDDIATLFDSLRTEWGTLDGLVHAIAFAPREALAGDFSRECRDRPSPSRTT
jgi:enoyl-[acyl-carrier protein] reductase I